MKNQEKSKFASQESSKRKPCSFSRSQVQNPFMMLLWAVVFSFFLSAGTKTPAAAEETVITLSPELVGEFHEELTGYRVHTVLWLERYTLGDGFGQNREDEEDISFHITSYAEGQEKPEKGQYLEVLTTIGKKSLGYIYCADTAVVSRGEDAEAILRTIDEEEAANPPDIPSLIEKADAPEKEKFDELMGAAKQSQQSSNEILTLTPAQLDEYHEELEGLSFHSVFRVHSVSEDHFTAKLKQSDWLDSFYFYFDNGLNLKKHLEKDEAVELTGTVKGGFWNSKEYASCQILSTGEEALQVLDEILLHEKEEQKLLDSLTGKDTEDTEKESPETDELSELADETQKETGEQVLSEVPLTETETQSSAPESDVSSNDDTPKEVETETDTEIETDEPPLLIVEEPEEETGGQEQVDSLIEQETEKDAAADRSMVVVVKSSAAVDQTEGPEDASDVPESFATLGDLLTAKNHPQIYDTLESARNFYQNAPDGSVAITTLSESQTEYSTTPPAYSALWLDGNPSDLKTEDKIPTVGSVYIKYSSLVETVGVDDAIRYMDSFLPEVCYQKNGERRKYIDAQADNPEEEVCWLISYNAIAGDPERGNLTVCLFGNREGVVSSGKTEFPDNYTPLDSYTEVSWDEPLESVFAAATETEPPAPSLTEENTSLFYAATTVNIRSGPGTEYEKIGSLSEGESIRAGSPENGWRPVLLSSGTGYVSSEYLSDSAPVKQTEPEVSAPVSNAGSERLVWIPTNGGHKYHSNSGCSGMKNPRQVTISEAQSLGFDACKKCF